MTITDVKIKNLPDMDGATGSDPYVRPSQLQPWLSRQHATTPREAACVVVAMPVEGHAAAPSTTSARAWLPKLPLG